MTRKQQETALVKAALKALPYRTKVRHGIGTGRRGKDIASSF